MIAGAQKIGIGKRQLLEDYYWEEVPLIFEGYAALSSGDTPAQEAYADDLW